MPGPGQTNTRIKPCAVRDVSRIHDFDPNTGYTAGHYVKTGKWGAAIYNISGGGYCGIIIISKYGTTLTSTSFSGYPVRYIQGRNSVASSVYQEWNGIEVTVRFNSGGTVSVPGDMDSFVSTMRGTSDATHGCNVSDLVFARSLLFRPSTTITNGANTVGSNYSSSDALYRVLQTHTITQSYSSPMINQNIVNTINTSTLFDPAYAELISDPEEIAYVLGRTSPSDDARSEGDPRPDCNAESAYEAERCGKCGRPI